MRELHGGSERMRVWENGSGPLTEPEAGLTVEWAGQVGHPSSYGLLGGRAAEETSVSASESGTFEDSLAGSLDQVQFGLPAHYEPAVLKAITSPTQITVAAHARIGSSESVFSRLASFLDSLLRHGVPVEDDELWTHWNATVRRHS